MDSLEAMVNVNGVVLELAQATIPVMDRGFLYGDSVYEVFRTRDGVPLFLNDHFDRLENSARLIDMRISQSRAVLIKEIGLTVAATGATRADPLYVRYQITRGEGPMDLYPKPGLSTRYVIIVKALPIWKEEFYSRGLDLAIPRVRRNPVNALDPNIKGGNYLNNILALSEAKNMGSDDSVMLTRDGFVTEASNSNVWFVIDGQLVTPSQGNLRGLTKKHIHKALKEVGIKSVESDIHVNELHDATECFVTSATRDVMPCAVLRLEDGTFLEFPKGGGKVTRQTREIFSVYVRDYVKQHQNESLI
uniref:Aminodeoxychorismate lyase n=1 Tax=uncultured gamma proteobacterium HF0500_32L01 TaxID=723574 RepID=E7C5Z6_9GAMM|nr:branched-chain amino acid aminotransferase/4-amino-4-deoxychorismate lyase [uncultured gamma proteobacterium HF0500_32L01]